MKKLNQITRVLLIFALLVAWLNGYSQRRSGPPPGRERIEVIKTTYLSRQMKLKPEEARMFWPVYDQYQEKMMEVEEDRMNNQQKFREGLDKLSDEEVNAMIDSHLRHAEYALNARKNMITDLRKILTPHKIAVFLRAEQQFRREMQHRVMERRREHQEPGLD